MKAKSLLLILAMACSLAASAYVPLVREGVKWVYLNKFAVPEYEYDGTNWYEKDRKIYSEYYYYECKGDTILNNETYKKLYQVLLTENHNVPQNTNQIQFSSKTEPYVFLSETDRVVIMTVNTDNEVIMDDLYNKIGEEWIAVDDNHIIIYDFNNPFPSLVEPGEDLIIDGELCRSYLYNNSVCLIEGVGFVSGNGFNGVCGGDLISPFDYGTDHWLYQVVGNDGRIIFKSSRYEATTDVNNDGATDGADLNILINQVLGKDDDDWHLIRSNVDGEGLIDGADINLIINKLLGK